MKNLLLLFFLIIIGCGSVPSIRPSGEGEKCITFSAGGPVTEIYDMTMPIPYSVLRYRWGMNDVTDIHIGFHTTMAIMGNIAIDGGITRQFARQSGWKPAFSAEGSIYGFYHYSEFSSIRIFPEISLIGSYNIKNRSELFYFGLQNMIQYTDPFLVFVPLIGVEVPFWNRLIVNIETKWYGPIEKSDNRAVDYDFRPFNYGALGFVGGLSFRF